jgi:hypothetical protein
MRALLHPAADLRVFVRAGEPPECLIRIAGPAGSSRSVCAFSLPDGLDVMARRAPIVPAALAGGVGQESGPRCRSGACVLPE